MAVSRINEAGLNINQYGNRNMIINGAMQVAQRGTSVTSITTADYRTCDRFLFGPTSGTYTVTQESSASTADGFTNSLKIETTATGSSTNATLQQRIEGLNLQHLGYGTSSAKQTTVSFYVKSNKTGTYTLELYNADATRQISKNYTIDASGTWERKTITFPSDTSNGFGNDSGLSLYLFWWLAAPSSFTSGTQNTSAWASATNANRVSSSIVDISDTVGNYWEITGVQWEVGDTATDFEHRTYGDELAQCQRYFQVVSNVQNDLIGMCIRYNSSNTFCFFDLPVEMRDQPAVEQNGASADIRISMAGNTNNFTSCTLDNDSSPRKIRLNTSTVVSAASDGAAGWWRINNSGGFINLDAEI